MRQEFLEGSVLFTTLEPKSVWHIAEVYSFKKKINERKEGEKVEERRGVGTQQRLGTEGHFHI